MSPLKRLSLSRKPKKKRIKNRRTSLNVNLSYVSDPNISAADENESPEKTIESVDSSSTKNRRTVRKDSTKTGDAEIPEEFLHTIRPSFVRLTSTPLPSKYATLLCSQKSSSPPKPQRRLSEISTIILETSMDITEVQGGLLPADQDSTNFIPDTEVPDFLETPLPAIPVIPDSQPDVSVDTVRTSMNVNTSLDSQIVDPRNVKQNLRGENRPENEAEMRSRSMEGRRASQEYIEWDGTISSTSTGYEIPRNSVIQTRAVIEHENFPNSSDSRETLEARTVVEVATEERNEASKRSARIGEAKSSEKENRNENETHETSGEERIEPPNGTPVLKKGIRNTRLDYSSEDSSKNDSSSSSSSSSSSLSASVSPLKSLGNIYQRIINSGLKKSEDSAKKSFDKNGKRDKEKVKKKKLMRLGASDIVDLSPVSVKLIRPANVFIIGKKTNGRNKTAKKFPRKKLEAKKKSKRLAAFEEEEKEEEEEEITTTEGKKTPPRKEKRVKKFKAKKIVIKKIRDVELRRLVNKNTNRLTNDRSDEEEDDDDDDDDDNDLSESEFRGTSLDDFEPKIDLTQRKTGRNNRPKIMIVATGLPIEEKKLIKETVARLGSAKLQTTVSRHTTHVVSKGIRTVNMLRGIIRGCWVVSFDWISKSREAGKWLDAESYEMKKFSEAIEKNRREKQLLKSAYLSELFLTCGSIHVSKGTSIPVSVLKELIHLAGGRIAPKAEKAKIIIGHGGLKEVWILDSITHGELQPFEQYSKKKSSNLTSRR